MVNDMTLHIVDMTLWSGVSVCWVNVPVPVLAAPVPGLPADEGTVPGHRTEHPAGPRHYQQAVRPQHTGTGTLNSLLHC